MNPGDAAKLIIVVLGLGALLLVGAALYYAAEKEGTE